MFSSLILPFAALSACVSSSPTDPAAPLNERQLNLVSPYAPSLGSCPSGNLIRAAKGVNPSEAAWVAQRKTKASASLKSWLSGTGASFPALSAAQYPTLGLVDGGGGLRGFLMSAGLHKALDANEGKKTQMSGLYQSMTYETGLSGSAASLGGYAADNWPTTSSLVSSLWLQSFASGVTTPNGDDPTTLALISSDIAAKAAAGFPVTIVDAWARLLGYLSLTATNGGQALKYSGILNLGGYTSHERPYPIMTSIGIENLSDGCGLPSANSTQYEFTPHEFGSWEAQIGNFMNTKYIGTTMQDGKPASQGLACTTGFDATTWVIGTSTNVFNQECNTALSKADTMYSQQLYDAVSPLLHEVAGNGIIPLYSQMPNPFLGLSSAPAVIDAPELFLVDGGETFQVPPIWPLLYRPDVSVLFIGDNSGDNPSNYRKQYPGTAQIALPGGRQIRNTYDQAHANGVGDRLPFIPSQARFIKNGLNKRTTFFGCNNGANSPAVTIIYMPNRPITYDSNIIATELQFNQSETNGVISNGVAVGTDNGAEGFGTCVGCAVMKKAAEKAGKSLPGACAACFKKYCFN